MLIAGDYRLQVRGSWLVDQIVATGSLVLRRFGDRAGEVAAHRFLDNERVTVSAILDAFSASTRSACSGRRIVAAQDTTEVNFSGRDRGRTGLGPAGNGSALGFFLHPVVAVDADVEAVLGVVSATVWTRDGRAKPARRDRRFADKESYRWLDGARAAAERLDTAREVFVVGDRESDIYSLFARRPEGIGLIVRVAHNRALAEGGRQFEADLTEHGKISVAVRAKPGQKARKACLRVKSGTLELAQPRNGLHEGDPKSLSVTMVETQEVDPPRGVKPLHWRLYTTMAVTNVEQAAEVVRLYRLRWRIEEVFRVLKSDGLKLEDTQVSAADRLFKLAALGLGAACRILQLTDARDGGPRPATDVIDADLIIPVAAIGKTLEGKTERQKNPHAEGSLAWLAWITARLGGWNCYYKPPGPKTMATGWQQLAARVAGFSTALDAQHV